MSGGHPLYQRPPHATVSCEWERQDYQRYNDQGDENFHHYTNSMTQFADTQDRANSMAPPTSDLRNRDVVGNNPVVPDPSREQIDLDQETKFTTDAGEARSEIPSTTCTDNAPRQEDSNTAGNDDSTALLQTDSETTPVDAEEEFQ